MKKRKPRNYWTKDMCHQEALKYKTRKEFTQFSTTASRIATKNGWSEEICSHMIRLKPISVHWTKEMCHQEALKYKTKSEFIKGNKGAYNWVLRKGMLDDVCLHMTSIKKPSGYWTKKRCYNAALKYKTKTDFNNNEISAVWSARKNGWYNEITTHMISRNWSYEKCHQEALKYKTKTDFNNNSRHAYDYAQKNKLLDIVCSHMIELHKPIGYWTKKRCHDIALKCKTREEFYSNYKSAYSSASNNNWLDEITTHFKKIGNWKFRCIYVYEFPDNCAYVGLTYNLEKRNETRKKNHKDGVTKHIKETNLQPIIKQLTEYIHVDDAIKMEKHYIKKYKENGWNMLNIAKGGATGGNLMLTFEMCHQVALKCKTRKEFYLNNRSAYDVARKNGWLMEITKHLPKHANHKYTTKEICMELALKCKTKMEFLTEYSGAYNSAKRNGWFDEITSHMIIKNMVNN